MKRIWRLLPFKLRNSFWRLRHDIKNPRNFLRLFWHKLPFKVRNNNLIRKLLGRILEFAKVILTLSSRKQIKSNLASILDGNQRQVIVFFPTYDWNIPLHQRPQHFASEFAKAGYLVFFCTPNFYDQVKGFEEIEENLFLTNDFKRALKHADIAVGYATDPNFSLKVLRRVLKSVKVFIYDFLDEMHVDLNGKVTKDLHSRHLAAIAHQKSIVSVSAQSLVEKVMKIDPLVKAVYVPNACDYDHFASSTGNKSESITIGYFGAIASWFDFELLFKLAEEFNDCKIKLIGQDYDGSLRKQDLKLFPNIELIPPINYSRLPFEAKFDIGILPFKINDITMATSPIKIFEYLAMGIPVVSVDLPECRGIPGVQIGADHNGFLDQIHFAITQLLDSSQRDMRLNFARTQTWKHRVESIINVLEERNPGLRG